MKKARHEPIQGLWIGKSLSRMEQGSIKSFLANGHPYHLYTYEEVSGVPEGTEVFDAHRILPETAIFKYREFDSYAGFSNHFRYQLLHELGGWWCDLDVICVRPFVFDSEIVIASERAHGHKKRRRSRWRRLRERLGLRKKAKAEQPIVQAATCVLKAPPGGRLTRYCLDVCEAKNPDELQWGETGPALVTQAIDDLSLADYVQQPDVFCPNDYANWQAATDEHVEIPEETRAVHLWNELWRRSGRDKNERYSSQCLYERLLEQY